VKSFLLGIYFVGGFPLKEESELLSQDNKGIIIWNYIVIVIIVSYLSTNYFGINFAIVMHIYF
jgi:hypothetical protein